MTNQDLFSLGEFSRRRQPAVSIFQIALWGDKDAVHLLERRLRRARVEVAETGQRYHLDEEPGKGWYLIADALRRRLVESLEPDLFQLGTSASVTRLTVTHHASGSAFHVTTDPRSSFKKFVQDPGELIFVPYRHIVSGCLECIENAGFLASHALSSKSTPRIAISLVSFAYEELGKAALLFRSAAESRQNGLQVAVIKSFRRHKAKLDAVIAEIFGLMKRVGEYGYERQPAVLDKLVQEFEMNRQSENLWTVTSTELWTFLLHLGEFGSLHREYCIYVGYDPLGRKWTKPDTQYDELTCERAAKLALMLARVYRDRSRRLSTFPLGFPRLNDLPASLAQGTGQNSP